MACAPLRVSFAGGGTDLEAFYQHEYGAVLSTTINKYVYVTVKQHGKLFNEKYRLNYAETEHVNELDDIKNEIARECLRLVPVAPPVYISTVADLPASSGLGSSSAFAIALLKSLHALRGERVSATQLADEAVHIEVDVLKHPIGKQDQVAAAYGGLNCFRFMSDGSTSMEPHSPVQTNMAVLFNHILMFWTGITRASSDILSEQKLNSVDKKGDLLAMRDQAESLNRLIKGVMDIEAFGRILDEGWNLKRQLASSISNVRIDDWYARAMQAGAVGGKICGAGGGGFLLFVAPPVKHEAIRGTLGELEEIDIDYEPVGVRLLVPSH